MAALAAAVLGTAAVGTAACRDVTAPAQDPTTVTYSPKLAIRLSDYTKDTSGVYYRDVAVGSGTLAAPKSTLTYYYTGFLADGRQFDTNVGGVARSLVLGRGDVIRGFDRGLVGIRAGGRRYLIIPPALGYGNTSLQTAIPAGSVLLFQIDVPSVTLDTTTTKTS